MYSLETLIEDMHLHHTIDHYALYLDNQNLFVRCSAVNGIGKLINQPGISSMVIPLTSLMIKYGDLSSIISSDVLGRMGDLAYDYVLQQTVSTVKCWLRYLSEGKDIEEISKSLSYLFMTLGKIASIKSLLPLSQLLSEMLEHRQDIIARNQLYVITLREGLLALGKLQSSQASPLLTQFIDQVNDEMKEVVLWALGSSGGDKARSALLKWIQKSDNRFSKKAAEAFNQELTIFLSSTFSDMQEDRDIIVNEVIPFLREECKKRGVKLSVMDLRWGLTPEDTSHDQTLINACLERIDYCRNHYFIFISLLGHNYGTVKFWKKTGQTHSVTEIEILHALSQEMTRLPNLSLFYIRHPLPDALEFKDPALGDEQKKRLRSLAQNLHTRIEGYANRFPQHIRVREYQHDQLKAFAGQVKDDVFAYIEQIFPPMAAISPVLNEVLAQYRYQQQQIADHFLPDQQIFNILNAHVKQKNTWPLLLFGDEGAGKSAFLCHWVEHYSQQNEKALIIYHNFRATPDAGRMSNLMGHIIWEIQRHQDSGFNENLPLTMETVLSLVKDTEIILLLDGLEQAEAAIQEMAWYPVDVPDNLYLICSTTYTESYERMAVQKGWHIEQMGQVLAQKDIEVVIKRSFQHYGKDLTLRQLNALLSLDFIHNPLFLNTVLNELAFFVPRFEVAVKDESIDYEKPILEKIARFSGVQNIEGLYTIIIFNLEETYPGSILSLLTYLLQHDEGQDDVQIDNWMTQNSIPKIDTAGMLMLKHYLGETMNIHQAHVSFRKAFKNILEGKALPVKTQSLNGIDLGRPVKDIPRIQVFEENNEKVYSVCQGNITNRLRQAYKECIHDRLGHSFEVPENTDVYQVLSKLVADDLIALEGEIREYAQLPEKERPAKFRKIIHVVDPESRGGDTNNLERAIDRAPDGGILLLAPGNYKISKSFTLKKNLVILGNSWQDTIVGTKPSLKNLFTLGGNASLIVHGLRLQGNHEKMTMFKLKDSSYAVFSSCVLEGKLSPTASKYEMEYEGIGIQLEKHSETLCHDCKFSGFTLAGISMSDTAQSTVINCKFEQNFWGVLCKTDNLCGEYLDSQFIRNICGGLKVELASVPLIANNTFDKNGYCGILFQQHSSGIVKNNRITESFENNIIIRDTAFPRIYENELFGAYWYGLTADSSNNMLSIYKNRIMRNEFGGVRFASEADGAFVDNIVSGNYLTGITISKHAAPVVAHNLVQNNQQNGIGIFCDRAPLVTANTCQSNGCHGITSVNEAAPALIGNLCSHNLMDGISITSTGRAVIRENTCMNNKQYGIASSPDGHIAEMGVNVCNKNAIRNMALNVKGKI